MKLPRILVLAIAALAAPAAVFAASFEGTVRMKMSDGRKDAHVLDYHIKEGLVRIDTQMGEDSTASIIMNAAKQEMFVLMPEQKMYMTHSLADAKPAVARATDDVTFEKTSETAKILGYDCVKYVSKSKNNTSDIWATEQLGGFMGMARGSLMGGKGKNSVPAAWEQELKNKNFFPLRVVSYNKKGKEEFRMEATSVEKAAQPDALFTPPADYQKFDLGGMMRGIGLPAR